MRKILVVEDDEHKDTRGEACIGNVEYWLKEEEVLASNAEHPLWPVPLGQREIEHVDYLAVEERCISSLAGQELRHLGGHWIVEKLAVGYAVDDVAYGSCCDESNASHKSSWQVGPLPDFYQIVNEEHREDDAQPCENGLAAKLHAERHTVVLDKRNLEPRRYLELLAIEEVGLDPDFSNLVKNDG